MKTINSQITAAALLRAANLKQKIDAMQAELMALLGGESVAETPTDETTVVPAKAGKHVPHNMSKGGRAAISAAQKARWAKVHQAQQAKEQAVAAKRAARLEKAAAKAKAKADNLAAQAAASHAPAEATSAPVAA